MTRPRSFRNDKPTHAGNLDNLGPVADSPRYTFVRGDIGSAEDLDATLPGHDVLVNFAAESHRPLDHRRF